MRLRILKIVQVLINRQVLIIQPDDRHQSNGFVYQYKLLITVQVAVRGQVLISVQVLSRGQSEVRC